MRAKTSAGIRTKRNFTANMYVDDITGAKPKIFAPKEVNKPTFFNDNSDILGSKSRGLHIGLNRGKSGSLFNSDIQGCQPDCVKFKTKRPPQNPLCPVYKLQQVEYIAPEPLKFIRDAMSVADIDGCKPKVDRILASRDNYNLSDIEGAKPKKPLHRNTVHDQIYYDVTAKKMLSRLEPSNPSNPVYKIRDDKGNLISYGEITGSRPKIAYFKTNNDICDMALKSKDI